MDRKILRLRRVCRFQALCLVAYAVCLQIPENPATAQDRGFRGGRGGFGGFRIPTPEETFDRIDQDGNGRVDAEEISNDRMAGFMLRDADVSGGFSRDEFVETLNQRREEMQRNGFGGRGGFGRRGGDADGGENGDSDRDRDRRRRGDGPSRDGSNSDSQNGASDGNSSGGGGAASVTNSRGSRPRITIDLQAEFLPGDTDRDGQLGLYEWRRFAGRSLKEFRELDRNQDGFVTPREVAFARPELATTASAVATASPATSSAGQSPTEVAQPVGTTPAGNAPPQLTNAAASRDAVRFFRFFDKNRDGQIAPDEWFDSSTKSLFTSNGVDLSQPMSAEDFSANYVRLSAAQN